MTREEAIRELKQFSGTTRLRLSANFWEALNRAIKTLEQQKPIEKFENAKDHIFKLAGDYKCWDNRLTHDEALELCHILEQEPCEDEIILTKEEYKQLLSSEFDNGYAKGYREALEQEPCDDAVSRKAVLDTLDKMDSVLDEDRTVETYKELLAACYKDLPPVAPVYKKEWIPVTERLPKAPSGTPQAKVEPQESEG